MFYRNNVYLITENIFKIYFFYVFKNNFYISAFFLIIFYISIYF